VSELADAKLVTVPGRRLARPRYTGGGAKRSRSTSRMGPWRSSSSSTSSSIAGGERGVQMEALAREQRDRLRHAESSRSRADEEDGGQRDRCTAIRTPCCRPRRILLEPSTGSVGNPSAGKDAGRTRPARKLAAGCRRGSPRSRRPAAPPRRGRAGPRASTFQPRWDR
jgi:hypothetical protein